MSKIDVEKLRGVAEALDRFSKVAGLPFGDYTKEYNLARAELLSLAHAASASAALPQLLAVYEAVERWRDGRCDDLPFCERGDHEQECTVEKRERELVYAIDTARKAP